MSLWFFRINNHDIHHGVVEDFYNAIVKRGFNVSIKKETEINEDDVKGKDLLITIGNGVYELK